MEHFINNAVSKAMVETKIETDSNSESHVLYNEDRKLLIFGSYFFLYYFVVLFVALKT